MITWLFAIRINIYGVWSTSTPKWLSIATRIVSGNGMHLKHILGTVR